MSDNTNKARITDSVSATLGSLTRKRNGLTQARIAREHIGPVGTVTATLWSPDGRVKQRSIGRNLVTDHGDNWLAARAYDNTQDIVSGMRLGTGTTAAAKSGAGAAIVTYITGSQQALDATATDATKGAGAGWRTTYIATWIAGDVTNAAIAEVVLTDETPLTDVAGTAANSVARYVFGATIDKQAGDSLEVTWQVDILGA